MKSKLLLLLVFLFLIGINVAFLLNLKNLPDANYPFILIVINIDILFLIVVSAIIFRKLIKVYLGTSESILRKKIANVLILYLFFPILLLNVLSVLLILKTTKDYMSGRLRELSKNAEHIYKELKDYELRNLYDKIALISQTPDDKIVSLPFVKYVLYEPCNFDVVVRENEYKVCFGNKVVVLDKKEQLSKSVEEFGRLALDLRSFVKAKDIITGLYIFFIVALSLLTLLATVWLSMHLARFISEPIERLTEKAVQISKGNLDVVIEEEKRGDEIEKLYKAFSQMKENLKELYENLKREKENLKKLLDALPVAILFIGKDGSNFRNKTFIRMFGDVSEIEIFLRETSQNRNIRMEKLDTEEGTIYIFEDITPIVLAERFKVWEEAVKRIAHEIKNPLTPIKLNLERILRSLQKDSFEREKLQELIKIILKEVDRINLLVVQFRNISFDRKLEPKQINLPQLLEEVKKVYLNAGINIEVKGEKTVIGDEGILKEVFFNLINNSIENGAKSIRIELNQEKLIYEDDGKGISPEEAKHIFEPYFSKNPKGFGIGMSMVKKIVEEHGWSVKVFPSQKGFHLEIDFRSKN